jgi:hypothetical protein
MMGWAVGFDSNWGRDIGYGVPTICDQPECDIEIDRGLGWVCGGEPYGGEHGCGLFFCWEHGHLTYTERADDHPPLCERCVKGEKPFTPKPDVAEWVNWKLTDPSWQQWRDENPEEVEKMRNG